MDISQKLHEMENERIRKMAIEHANKIAEARKLIEDVLIKNNLTVRDWNEIIKMIDDRCTYFFSKTEFLTIKAYEQSKLTTVSGGKTEQQGQNSASTGQ